MKFYAASLLAALAAASPIAIPEPKTDALVQRALGLSANELEDGSSSSCPKAILIFARGTLELGNLGALGIALGDVLQHHYGSDQLWVQGVGGPYSADLLGNLDSQGSTPNAIAEMVRLYDLAASKCPNSIIVSGGYSQGAALAAAATTDVSSAIKDQIKGVVLFGYTKNQQNNGGIPDFPSDKLKVICAWGDTVCDGTLIITPAHLSYLDEAATTAPDFLISKIGN